jgi:hypothetical protein
VFTKKPESLVGKYLPDFTVAVQLKDLSDHELATLTCGNETALEAKGGGSGCGCFLGTRPGRIRRECHLPALVLRRLALLLLRLRKK